MITNSEQFLKEQYANSSNLDIRIRMHELYSHAEKDWHEWVFDNISFEQNSKIVEYGCGSGVLWAKNENKIKKDWSVLLSDMSDGMLKKSKQHLSHLPNISFQLLDVQQADLDSSSFDVAIANHMLYHVPDINKALTSIRRTLKPGGKFYAATNGTNHMREIYELIEEYDPSLSLTKPINVKLFGLENGGEILGNNFQDVKLIRYDSHLRVTNAQDLLEYMFSMGAWLSKELVSPGSVQDFIKFIEKKKNSKGYIPITKDTGLFVCTV